MAVWQNVGPLVSDSRQPDLKQGGLYAVGDLALAEYETVDHTGHQAPLSGKGDVLIAGQILEDARHLKGVHDPLKHTAPGFQPGDVPAFEPDLPGRRRHP